MMRGRLKGVEGNGRAAWNSCQLSALAWNFCFHVTGFFVPADSCAAVAPLEARAGVGELVQHNSSSLGEIVGCRTKGSAVPTLEPASANSTQASRWNARHLEDRGVRCYFFFFFFCT
jgi:hypothetical protein